MQTLLLAAALAVAGSQAPVDFSGRWTIETAATAPAGGTAPGESAQRPDRGVLQRGDMSSGWGSPLTITQDAKQLAVEQALFSRYDINPQPRSVYALDGSETKNTMMVGHATQIRTSMAAWAGQSLRILTKYPGVDPGTGKPFTFDVTYRLTLESPGTMVIETTRAAAFGGKEVSTRTVYRKN